MAMLLNPTIQISQWDPLDDPTAALASFFTAGKLNHAPEFDALCDEAMSAFSCDHFRMYEFKIRACARGKSHDWTKCPYAHSGEKARRRDPRKFQYSGAECAEFRLGSCNNGDSCEFAHGVFETWLHPDRYRTQPCRDGSSCNRRVCFFAHSPDQLRTPTNSLAGEVASLMQDLQLNRWGCRTGFGSPRGSTPTGVDVWEKAYEEEPAMERVESGRDLRAMMYAKLMRDNSLERACY